MSRLARFLELSPVERRLFLSAAGLVLLVQAGMRLFAFQTLLRLINRYSSYRSDASQADPAADPAYIGQVILAVRCVSGHLPGDSTCLAQALVGRFLLCRANYPATLCIGVKKDNGGELRAHAWVECGGVVLIGGPAEALGTYQQLPELDRSAP